MNAGELIEHLKQLDPESVMRVTLMIASHQEYEFPPDVEMMPVVEFVLDGKVVGWLSCEEQGGSFASLKTQ